MPVSRDPSPELKQLMKIGLISLGCPKNLVDAEVMLGLAQQAGHELTHDAAERRRARRQHLRVHRLGEAGVDRRDPRDGAAQDGRRVPAADRHRLPRRALPRRAERARSPRSTRCSAPARCRRSSARSAAEPRRRSPLTFVRRRRSHSPARGADARHGTRAAASRSPRRAADLSLRRRHAAPPGDAEALRLREDRRRLRLQVRVLHHPDAARRTTAAGRATRSSREARALAARGVKELLLISQDTTFYGIDRRRARRAGRAAARAERDRRARVDPAALPLPDDDRRRRRSTAMAECEKVCKYIDLPLQHASNAVLQADEAARARGRTTTSCSTRIRDARARRRPPHDLHRRLPGETEADVDELCDFVADARVRSRRRLHLFARGRHVGATR